MKLKNLLIFISFLTLVANLSFAKELNLIKEKSFKVSSHQSLIVKTDVGDIIIKTWDKNEASIKIFGNQNAERNMEFTFNQDEKGVEVIGEKETGSFLGWFNRIDLKYEIILPMEFNIDLKTAGGDIVTKTLVGDLKIKTSGGDIFIKDSKGNLNGSTSGGDITVDDFVGNTVMSTSGGDIQVNSSKGKTVVTTSGGDIVIKSSEGKVEAGTSGGDISLEYSGKNYGIDLSTSGGDIDAAIPTDFNADIEIRTSGGSIHNGLSSVKATKISKSTIIGKFNDGGDKVICKTSGGDINISER